MDTIAKTNALMSTDFLAAHLDETSIRVIDVDEDTTAYDKGHIPGSVGWNWVKDLHSPVCRDYINRAELGDLLARSGVADGTRVVLYGDNNNGSPPMSTGS